ncbi:hypothetical protein Ciccas_008422 [Cichlidogyrus casuarinus]|uniref:Uncharacterized protein n=1 Tax=Cichlidogyrus casuarinus TaxID=1844966 RepID=A0ABD2Q481_9PLAT
MLDNKKVAYDDSYPADDCMFEKMMQEQNVIMTANSVSPASPILVPPGPPTSPVPSPGSTITSTLSDSLNFSSTKPLFKLRSRRRRNAICESNHLTNGLKEFLVSYVVSTLSDSMNNSLNLETCQDSLQATVSSSNPTESLVNNCTRDYELELETDLSD